MEERISHSMGYPFFIYMLKLLFYCQKNMQ